jgi:hypothetical protein
MCKLRATAADGPIIAYLGGIKRGASELRLKRLA